MRILLLLVVVILFAEIWSIGHVQDWIGTPATLVLLFADFLVGRELMRGQGVGVLMQRAQQMKPGESPMDSLVDAIVKSFAGILLIIPGFFSDLLALLLLIPVIRRFLFRRLFNRVNFQSFSSSHFSAGFGGPSSMNGDEKGNVYEHEGSARVDEEATVIEHLPQDKTPPHQ